jgi:hypothetical protein
VCVCVCWPLLQCPDLNPIENMWDDSDNLAKIQNYIYLDKVTENLRKGSMPLEPACVGFKTIFKLSLEFKTEFSF